ncbi:MAG: SNF2-related protein, partial [Acidobacteriota bacterium]
MPILAEHQREAVDRAVEILSAHGGAILADDVGLGKSFVAAEVARRSGREVDVVVPASLVPQWRETLAAFGVEASLMTHESLRRSPIVSDPSRRRLIVVDEAHAFRNPATQKYDALARRSVGASLLLVTATPFCNRIGDVRALIDLIAVDDALSSTGIPSIDVAFDRRDLVAIDTILAALIIRRGPAVLPYELRFGTLDRQIVWHPVLDIRNEVGALIFPLVGSAPLLRRFLWRRLESSEEALLESIRRQLRFYERALECLANGSSVLQKRDYRRAFGHEEDRDAFQQVLFWDLFVPPGGGVSAAVIEEEVRRLHVLRNVVERSPRDKRLLLVERCESESEPMLVFTGSTATARDLATFLPGRCGLVTARERERESIIESFRR